LYFFIKKYQLFSNGYIPDTILDIGANKGAELFILKGATNILEKTDFIILEVPLFGQYNENVPNFLEHIFYMNTLGFVVYDIIANHYVNDFNMQVDILFINKNHSFNTLVNELLLK
jgi:hypothetical protein